MPISEKLKEIYSGTNTVERWIETLQFSHSRFNLRRAKTQYAIHCDPDNLVHDFLDENGDPVEFRFVPFKVQLPTLDNSGRQDLSFSLCNIGRELMDSIEAANATPKEPIVVTYRVYLEGQNKSPQNDPPLVLTINEISANAKQVTAVATRFDILNRPFPMGDGALYTVKSFPGLNR